MTSFEAREALEALEAGEAALREVERQREELAKVFGQLKGRMPRIVELGLMERVE